MYRCEDFLKRYRSVVGLATEPIGRSDDLSGLHSSTRQQGTTHSWPVITSAAIVDLRRSPRFSPDDNSHVVLQTSFMKILDKR